MNNRQPANSMPIPNQQSASVEKTEAPVSSEPALDSLAAELAALKAENQQLKASNDEISRSQINLVLEDKKRKPKVAPSNEPTEVRATRAGYYENQRLFPGDVFVIKGPHELGSWMEPTGKKLK